MTREEMVRLLAAYHVGEASVAAACINILHNRLDDWNISKMLDFLLALKVDRKELLAEMSIPPED